MNFILGTKIRMTQLFVEDGRVIPVTEIKVAPNTVVRVKTKQTDNYDAVVLACGERNKVRKALAGFFKNLGKFRYIKEFRTDGNQIDLKVGDQIGLTSFVEGEKVKVSSVSKGKGFQGVVKRHGFHGGPRSHGDKDQMRMPGSAGATEPRRVFKGRKMAGRMGGDMVSIPNLEIAKIDLENNLLYLKGAIAGGSSALVIIKGDGQIKIYEKPAVIKEALMEEKSKNPVEIVEINNENIAKENLNKKNIDISEGVIENKEEILKKEEISADTEAVSDNKEEAK